MKQYEYEFLRGDLVVYVSISGKPNIKFGTWMVLRSQIVTQYEFCIIADVFSSRDGNVLKYLNLDIRSDKMVIRDGKLITLKPRVITDPPVQT